MDTIAIGARVECEGYIGTVLYKGPIPTTKGDWLGIEWDHPQRGKHDGSYEGIHYFTTKHPTSGSFVRAKKVNLGQEFVAAVQARYGRKTDHNAGVIQEDMFVVDKNNQLITVEVVGAQSVNLQQGQLEQLVEVAMRGEQISHVDDEGRVASVVPSVEELDLSLNLLPSWAEVARIVGQLNKIHTLNVSDNHLQLPENPASLSEAFHMVRVVYCNRMTLTWSQVLHLPEMMPNLNKIHLCFNAIGNITTLAPTMKGLSLLNLESNPLQSWNDVLVLGKLQNLDTLILNATGLDRMEFPDASSGQKTSLFPSLKALSVSHNKMDKWDSINELEKLPNLTDLKIQGNPIMTIMNHATVYGIILAKIGNLQYCNGSQVTLVDRKGGEIDYLRMNGREWRQCGGNQDPAQNNPSVEFVHNHPRYQALVEKYGAPEDSELKVQSSALKTNLISVTINSHAEARKKPMKKKLPLTMSLQKLKTLLQRLYKVDPLNMKVTYSSQKMEGPEIEMDSDQKEIGYYSIEDGDTIFVNW